MHSIVKMLIFSTLLTLAGGCAYTHYLGMHGPTIKMFPDIHHGLMSDEDCLDCHHPDRDPEGPATSHPQFTGCLKCHNDPPK